MFFGIFLVTMLYLGIFTVYHLAAILIGGLLCSFLCKHYRVPVASWVMEHFEREHNRKTFPGKGPILFMIGSIFVVYFFPLKIALAAIMMLSVGDAASHIFGKILSRKTYKYLKSIEGTAIGIASGFAVALLFVDVNLAFFGSLIAMGFEGMNLGWDDNLWIPIIAASMMSVL